MNAAAVEKREIIRRLRYGDVRKLLRDRCGYGLPDDDAGREYLYELLLPISTGPNAAIKMPNAIELWAPWMQQGEATELIDRINLTPIRQRMPTAKKLGKRLNLTFGQRERLRLKTIACCDRSPQQMLAWRRAKARERMRRLRQLRGSKSRAEYETTSLSRTKPWLALGISRRTWERRRVASPCAIKLENAANTLASPQQTQLPKGGRAHAPAVKLSTTIKVEKPKRQRKHASVDATAIELREHTCVTSSANEPVPIANDWRRNAKTPDEQLNDDEEK